MPQPFIIVFDLDDTLYLEKDFAWSGYRAASAWLEQEHSISGLEAECQNLFRTGHRQNIFDQALTLLNIDQPSLVASLVDIYRSHTPEISLQPDAKRFFGQHTDMPFALITDGPVATQTAKIAALDIAKYFGHIVCSDTWGIDYRKPHPKPYRSVEEWSGLRSASLIYVADNATKDFITPNARGWHTVQIKRPDRVHKAPPPTSSHRPHAIIASLDDLDAYLSHHMIWQMSVKSGVQA